MTWQIGDRNWAVCSELNSYGTTDFARFLLSIRHHILLTDPVSATKLSTKFTADRCEISCRFSYLRMYLTAVSFFFTKHTSIERCPTVTSSNGATAVFSQVPAAPTLLHIQCASWCRSSLGRYECRRSESPARVWDVPGLRFSSRRATCACRCLLWARRLSPIVNSTDLSRYKIHFRRARFLLRIFTSKDKNEQEQYSSQQTQSFLYRYIRYIFLQYMQTYIYIQMRYHASYTTNTQKHIYIRSPSYFKSQSNSSVRLSSKN